MKRRGVKEFDLADLVLVVGRSKGGGVGFGFRWFFAIVLRCE